MATHFELWNDLTNNLIDEFDTIEQAIDEVRWRIATHDEDVAQVLSLLQLDDAGTIEAVINGEELVRQSREVTILGD